MEKYKEVERSIITTYRKTLWTKFAKAVGDYQLIKENDKIAVCMSGGKDSFIMAKLFQELQKHGKVKFDLIFLVMDPGYNEYNRTYIEENAKLLNIPLTIFESDIFDIVSSLKEGSPCYLCARMRRGHLYNKAKELGCNKIALGHHYDDVIETILLNMFYGGEFKTMMPKLHSSNYEGMELIRPMYLIREHDIIAWRNYHELTFINCACRFTEGCSLINDGTSKRKEMKELIYNMHKVNSSVEHNIFKSVDNINMDAIIGYRIGKEKHSFLDEYEK